VVFLGSWPVGVSSTLGVSIDNKGNGASDPILLVPVPDTADDDDSKEGLGPVCLDGSVRKTCLVGQCSKRLDQNLLPQQV